MSASREVPAKELSVGDRIRFSVKDETREGEIVEKWDNDEDGSVGLDLENTDGSFIQRRFPPDEKVPVLGGKA
jgi:hypothetical protein